MTGVRPQALSRKNAGTGESSSAESASTSGRLTSRPINRRGARVKSSDPARLGAGIGTQDAISLWRAGLAAPLDRGKGTSEGTRRR